MARASRRRYATILVGVMTRRRIACRRNGTKPRRYLCDDVDATVDGVDVARSGAVRARVSRRDDNS